MTAEVVHLIGEAEARERLARVRVSINAAAGDLAALYEGRAWLTLGFGSWDELCDHEFGGVRVALPRDQRRETVGRLREAGMSTRAIGTAVGVSEGTIRSDLDQLRSSTQLPEAVTGLDGRVRPAKVTRTETIEEHVDLATGEILAAPAPQTSIRDFIDARDPHAAEDRAELDTQHRWVRAFGAVSRIPTDFDPDTCARHLDSDHLVMARAALTSLVVLLDRIEQGRRPIPLTIAGGRDA